MGNKITPNQTGVNSLLVFELPAEFDFKFGTVPLRVLATSRSILMATSARGPSGQDKSKFRLSDWCRDWKHQA
jgi:hypothetical protein